MDSLNARSAPANFLAARARELAARAVKRSLAGRTPPPQTCRSCGAAAACRTYEFKARRRLRIAEPSGALGANTTWIMAKHEEMVPGSGAVCPACLESFLDPYFAKIMRRLFWLFAILCAPFPLWLAIQHRRVHEMTNHAFVALCFLGVLFLLGLTSLGAAWFADYFLSHRFNRAVLIRLAAVERAPLRERFPAETYALQIGLRFNDDGRNPSEEIVCGDDSGEIPASPPPSV